MSPLAALDTSMPTDTTPMWLSHHDPEHHDRCVIVAGRAVCRRCLLLYPVMLGVAALQLAGAVPADVGVALMWVLPLPVVAEWVAEHLGGARYSASRQVATTALAGGAFGVALGRHVRHPFEFAATAPAVTYTVLCLIVWWIGSRRAPDVAPDWEADFEAAERERLAALVELLDQPASYTKSINSSTAPTRDGSRSL